MKRSRHRPGARRSDRRRLRQPSRRADLQHRPRRLADRGSCRSPRQPPPSTRSAVRASRRRTSPPGLLASGAADVVMSCGVESMSRVGLGAAVKAGPGFPMSASYPFESASQFEGAERIADKWGITRQDTDEFGLRSQTLAIQAWNEGRFDREVVPITAPIFDAEGKRHRRDPGCLQGRRPARDEPREARHAQARRPRRTACTPPVRRRRSPTAPPRCCSRPSRRPRNSASRRGPASPRSASSGVDPVLMLTGPIDATDKLLAKTGLTHQRLRPVRSQRSVRVGRARMAERECSPDPERVNVNGGAIAIGHPVGCTGRASAHHRAARTRAS